MYIKGMEKEKVLVKEGMLSIAANIIAGVAWLYAGYAVFGLINFLGFNSVPVIVLLAFVWAVSLFALNRLSDRLLKTLVIHIRNRRF